MKRTNKKSRINDLAIDVIAYAFLEWLIRQGVFAAFKKNYESNILPLRGFREQLRHHIQLVLDCPGLDVSCLVSSAFTYVETPEGADFWRKQSDAWKRFCTKFQTLL